MSSQYELTVVNNGVVTHALPIGTAPLRIGRGPGNDLVLSEDTISWHHAQVWVEGDAVWAHDLSSRNGTFLNEERVKSPVRVKAGDEMRVGPKIHLRVRSVAAPPTEWRPLLLEDETSGVQFMLRSDRFLIGSGEDCDLRLEDAPDRAATVIIHDDGEIWIGTDEAEWSVKKDEVFQVSGRRMKIVEGAGSVRAPTLEYGGVRYPYTVQASASGVTGPQAVLRADDGQELLLTGNRGVLMYLLSKKLSDDRDKGLGRSEEGWCSDADIASGIWGKGARDANNLHVLVYRLRKHLKKQGFDPWFIEKRHWGIRARLREVDID